MRSYSNCTQDKWYQPALALSFSSSSSVQNRTNLNHVHSCGDAEMHCRQSLQQLVKSLRIAKNVNMSLSTYTKGQDVWYRTKDGTQMPAKVTHLAWHYFVACAVSVSLSLSGILRQGTSIVMAAAKRPHATGALTKAFGVDWECSHALLSLWRNKYLAIFAPEWLYLGLVVYRSSLSNTLMEPLRDSREVYVWLWDQVPPDFEGPIYVVPVLRQYCTLPFETNNAALL